MRGLLMVLPVLATLALPRPASAADDEHSSAESNLLSLFGFRRRPRTDRGGKVAVPPEMLELYHRQTALALDTLALPLPGRHTHTANTVRSFTHAESQEDEAFRTNHRFRLLFDVATIPADERLQAVELWLPRSVVETDGAVVRQRVLVHDIVRPGVRGRRAPLLRLLDSRQVDVSLNGSVTLDVLPAAERWLRAPHDNHGLLVEVKPAAANKHHVRLRNDADAGGREPLLLAYTDDGRAAPRPAHELDRRRDAARKPHSRDTCRRHPLYVNFADVGWDDWIVAPSGYDAFFCSGDCSFPLPQHINSTVHAIVQAIVNSMNPDLAPKACCVPTELMSISILYRDEKDKVVLKNYQDMSVLECGCR